MHGVLESPGILFRQADCLARVAAHQNQYYTANEWRRDIGNFVMMTKPSVSEHHSSNPSTSITDSRGDNSTCLHGSLGITTSLLHPDLQKNNCSQILEEELFCGEKLRVSWDSFTHDLCLVLYKHEEGNLTPGWLTLQNRSRDGAKWERGFRATASLLNMCPTLPGRRTPVLFSSFSLAEWYFLS